MPLTSTRQERFALNEWTDITLDGHAKTFSCRVENVSCGGMLLRHIEPLEVGSFVSISSQLPHQPSLSTTGEVVRVETSSLSRKQCGIGIRFDQPDNSLSQAYLQHSSQSMKMARLEKINKLTRIIHQDLLVPEVLDHVYVNFRGLIPFDRLAYARMVNGSKNARLIWVRSEYAKHLLDIGYERSLHKSSLLDLGKKKQIRIINDLQEHLAENPNSESTKLILDEGLRSSLTCPLEISDNLLGFLFFSSRKTHTYSSHHIETFEDIAGQLTIALYKNLIIQELAAAKKKLEQSTTRLAKLATKDYLTGTLNRRAFEDVLKKSWGRDVRNQHPLSLIILDIDHFKDFNDRFGHLRGDECLRSVAQALSEALKRPGDILGRYGGEEFAIILEDTPSEGAYQIAEDLRRAVMALDLPAAKQETSGLLTVSLGCATIYPNEKGSSRDLIASADRALYQAKRAGRNRVVSVRNNA